MITIYGEETTGGLSFLGATWLDSMVETTAGLTTKSKKGVGVESRAASTSRLPFPSSFHRLPPQKFPYHFTIVLGHRPLQRLLITVVRPELFPTFLLASATKYSLNSLLLVRTTFPLGYKDNLTTPFKDS